MLTDFYPGPSLIVVTITLTELISNALAVFTIIINNYIERKCALLGSCMHCAFDTTVPSTSSLTPKTLAVLFSAQWRALMPTPGSNNVRGRPLCQMCAFGLVVLPNSSSLPLNIRMTDTQDLQFTTHILMLRDICARAELGEVQFRLGKKIQHSLSPTS